MVHIFTKLKKYVWVVNYADLSLTLSGNEKESRGRGKRRQPRSPRDPTASFPSASTHHMTPQDGVSTGFGPGCPQKWDSHGQQSVDMLRPPPATHSSPSRGTASPESMPDGTAGTPHPASGLAEGLDKVSFSSSSDLEKAQACLHSLEKLWFSQECGCPSEKEKKAQTAQILGECFEGMENPWEAAVFLTQTARDYMTAKPTCLAYFCMRTFSR